MLWLSKVVVLNFSKQGNENRLIWWLIIQEWRTSLCFLRALAELEPEKFCQWGMSPSLPISQSPFKPYFKSSGLHESFWGYVKPLPYLVWAWHLGPGLRARALAWPISTRFADLSGGGWGQHLDFVPFIDPGYQIELIKAEKWTLANLDL